MNAGVNERGRMVVRQWNLLLLLRRHGPARMRELAAALQVTERTIRRDLSILRLVFPITRVEVGDEDEVRWRLDVSAELAEILAVAGVQPRAES